MIWGDSITPKAIWHVVKAAAKRADIKDLAPHDLRRYAARKTMPSPVAKRAVATVSSPQLRAGLDGVIDSLLAAQHVLEMFRRPLPKNASRSCLDRLSNRLTKILTEVRTAHDLKTGRDWPVMPVSRRLSTTVRDLTTAIAE